MTTAAPGYAPARSASSRRASSRVTTQCAWLFAVALFGYAVVGNIISLLQLDSRVLTIPFRMAVALFSVWLIVSTRRLKIDLLRKVMLAIWFLYVLRLLHDWLVPQLEGADYALQFFLAASVLPAIGLMKAQGYDGRRFAIVAFVVASVGALVTLLAAFFGSAEYMNVAESGGRLSLAAIDPVSLGNEAVGAVLCGLVLWRNAKTRFRIVLASVIFLLLWCLMLTGSKGPALALLLCVGLWALRRGYAWRFGILALPLLIWVVVSNENPLAARLERSADDQSTLDRLLIFNDSLTQIANSPLIGSAFVELNSGYYPHDIFVEAGLAFGVPVALVFSAMLVIGTYKAWRTLNSDYDLIGLIFFQGLFAAAISAAIYGSILLWVTMALLPAAARSTRNARSRSPSPELASPAAGR